MVVGGQRESVGAQADGIGAGVGNVVVGDEGVDVSFNRNGFEMLSSFIILLIFYGFSVGSDVGERFRGPLVDG